MLNLIKSEVLNCEIVICERGDEKKAKRKYPGRVIYFHDELESLRGLTPEEVRGIHDIKDILGGHIDTNKPAKVKKEKRPATLAQMRKQK